MLDFSIRALLLEQRFDDAEDLFAKESPNNPNAPETKRAKILIDTLNGADVLREYLEHQDGKPASFDDRSLFLHIARNQLERILQNAEAINIRCQAAELLGLLRDPGAISPLARVLGSRDVSPGTLLVRRAAAEALSLMGGPNVRPIAEELVRDEDPVVRRALLVCLSKDPQSKDIALLLETLQLGGPSERTVVAQILSNPIYPNAAVILRSLLMDATETVRLAAARSLAAIGPTDEDIDFFCNALTQEHDPRAARILGLLGGDRAVSALVDVLHVAEEETAMAAAIALGELRDNSALYPLIALARSERTLLSVVSLQSLAMLGEPGAVSQIVPLVVNKDRRIAVAKAIGQLGGQGVLPILLDLLTMAKEQQEDWRSLKELTLALGYNRDKGATPALLSLLQGKDERLKGAAAEALGMLRDPRATPVLLATLQTNNAEARLKASKALGAVCDPASVPGLFPILEQPQLEYRAAAAYPLGVMAWADMPNL
jgi:HEAT repeat protein